MNESKGAPATGTRLHEFELIRILGAGGFGIVYLARDTAQQRMVAIKEYLPSSLARRDGDSQVRALSDREAALFDAGLASFLSEAQMLARFDHPALVRMHRSWEEHGTAYTVMPYYEGVTLKEMRGKLSGVPEEAWLGRALQTLLGAIDLLHQASVFHRDISPDNILVQPDGAPVLLDFGAARQVIADRTQTLTSILKPSFAPIEQYSHSGELRQGPWTDLYSLGAVMYFMVIGHPPSPAAARALDDDVPLLARWAAEGSLPLSPALCAAIDWCLEFRPQHRPQRVQDVLDVLDGRRCAPAPTRTARVAGRGEPADRSSASWTTTFGMARGGEGAAPKGKVGRARRKTLALLAMPLCVAAAGWGVYGYSAETRSQPTMLAAAIDIAPARSERVAPAAKAKPKAEPAARTTAQASCSNRNIFTRPHCLQTTCAKPAFRNDPTCRELAAERRKEAQRQRH